MAYKSIWIGAGQGSGRGWVCHHPTPRFSLRKYSKSLRNLRIEEKRRFKINFWKNNHCCFTFQFRQNFHKFIQKNILKYLRLVYSRSGPIFATNLHKLMLWMKKNSQILRLLPTSFYEIQADPANFIPPNTKDVTKVIAALRNNRAHWCSRAALLRACSLDWYQCAYVSPDQTYGCQARQVLQILQFLLNSHQNRYTVACNVCKMKLQDSTDRTYGPFVICYFSRVDVVQIVILTR